jgi:hypothetical protein
MKLCYGCKIEKNEEEFSNYQYKINSGRCRKCREKYKIENSDKIRNWKQNDYINNRKTYILGNAKNRAKDKNLDFDLTQDDLHFPFICPILDIPILLEYGNGRTGNGPSIDRIDNTKGYIKDNVIIVSDRANTLKKHSNQEDREKIYKFYKELYENVSNVSSE